MALITHKEAIALEVCYIGRDFSISSKEAADKIKVYLETNYQSDVVFNESVVSKIVDIVKEYRKGKSLECTVTQIIDVVDTGYNLNSNKFDILDPFAGIQTLQPLIPAMSSSYSIGVIEEKTSILNYNHYAWIDCAGQNVFVSDYPDLFWYIKQDIIGFEDMAYQKASTANVPALNIYVFTETPASGGGQMFNVPTIPGYAVRARK